MFEPTNTVRIFKVDYREIHFPVGSQIVCVCWNLKTVTQTSYENGTTYAITEKERYGEPYIDFVTIKGDGDDCYVDEDSPVEGGLSVADALLVSEELKTAARYLKEQTEPEGDNWNLPEKLSFLDITAPPDWNEYNTYLEAGGKLEYEDWKKRNAGGNTNE